MSPLLEGVDVFDHTALRLSRWAVRAGNRVARLARFALFDRRESRGHLGEPHLVPLMLLL